MDEISNLDHAPTPEEGLRRRLVNRIIIAALLVAGLLGSLAMFEEIYTPAPKHPPVPAKLALPPRPAPAAEPETKPIAPAAEAKPETRTVPERTAAPSAPRPPQVQPAPVVAPHRAPAPRPVTQAVERRFALQMGVFGNMANAEDLRAKLVANGIPATIEARVSVGPFRTRQEVDAARAKLKELGLDDGLLITIKK
ncbi:MAG: SPOR domain-containing protein [Sulfuritalea sp.]